MLQLSAPQLTACGHMNLRQHIYAVCGGSAYAAVNVWETIPSQLEQFKELSVLGYRQEHWFPSAFWWVQWVAAEWYLTSVAVVHVYMEAVNATEPMTALLESDSSQY